jgi:hypothetical protein
VEPLKAQLAEVDQAIKDQLDLIAATKANISKNDQKIDKLLQSATSHVYMCVRRIALASLYNFSIGFWNCTDIAVLVDFSFIRV